jgi:hypothetical protein
VLVGAILVVSVLLLVVPLMVQWSRQEARWSVKQQKSTVAFNLADAAIDRGMWKLKSSTSCWAQAVVGTVQAGYNFDTVYTDIEGGVYRIRFATGPAAGQVTVTAEGRDGLTRQTRALRAVFENKALPGPMLSGGAINIGAQFEAHWGPILAHGNIALSGAAAADRFPRKLSKQVVSSSVAPARDVNGMPPPNTDNLEWWSDYAVPDLPLLDFVTMRASATSNGTLNYFTTAGASGAGKCIGWGGHGRCEAAANNWAAHSGQPHFFDSMHHPLGQSNRIWYYDNNLILTGDLTSGGGHRLGLYGTSDRPGEPHHRLRGQLHLHRAHPGHRLARVRLQRHRREQPIPGRRGFSDQQRDLQPRQPRHGRGGPPAANTDVGVRGFVYIGGNFALNDIADLAGTIWVVGNTTVGAAVTERALVFYEDVSAGLPILNVVLSRLSWDETAAERRRLALIRPAPPGAVPPL